MLCWEEYKKENIPRACSSTRARYAIAGGIDDAACKVSDTGDGGVCSACDPTLLLRSHDNDFLRYGLE
jgi:hypothetical protein